MRQRDRGDERGAVAVLIAVLLAVLLGFSALVVDVGLDWGARRIAQNAADGAALAGAAKLPEDPAGAVAAAQAYLDANVSNLSSSAPAGWESNQTDTDGEIVCFTPGSDPDPRTQPPASWWGCPAGKTAMMVLTPPVKTTYALAGLLGRAGNEVKATAEAGAFRLKQVLPFGLPATLVDAALGPGGDGEVCMKTAPPAVDACHPPGAGDYMAVDIPRASNGCGNGGSDYRDNVQDGADHPITGIDYNGNVEISDKNGCGGYKQGTPTVERVETAKGDLADFRAGIQARLANLADPAYYIGSGANKWDGILLSNSIPGPPKVCQGPLSDIAFWNVSGAQAYTEKWYAPGKHFSDYQAAIALGGAAGPVFDPSIASSPRFVYLPVLRDDVPNGANDVVVKSFMAAYIEKTIANDDAAGSPPTLQCVAPSGATWDFDGITAYLLPDYVLPGDLQAGRGGWTTYAAGQPKTVHLID